MEDLSDLSNTQAASSLAFSTPGSSPNLIITQNYSASQTLNPCTLFTGHKLPSHHLSLHIPPSHPLNQDGLQALDVPSRASPISLPSAALFPFPGILDAMAHPFSTLWPICSYLYDMKNVFPFLFPQSWVSAPASFLHYPLWLLGPARECPITSWVGATSGLQSSTSVGSSVLLSHILSHPSPPSPTTISYYPPTPKISFPSPLSHSHQVTFLPTFVLHKENKGHQPSPPQSL